MKILFALSNVVFFRHFDEVIRDLCERGHEVIVLRSPDYKTNVSDEPLRRCKAEVSGFDYQDILPCRLRSVGLATLLRLLLDYAVYFRPNHPSPELSERIIKKGGIVTAPLRLMMRFGFLRRLLLSNRAQQLYRIVDHRMPPLKRVQKSLQNYNPDILLICSPFIYSGYPCIVEYGKAGKKLGIPTVIAIASWDNLTTKGTIHFEPDLILLWNEPMMKEAVELHDMKKEIIHITGAPTFDFWFKSTPTLDRDRFCQHIGLNASQPYVVYVCSSTSITGDNETEFVNILNHALRHNPRTKHVQILIRPHPFNPTPWLDFSADHVVVWPRSGAMPDMPDSKQDFFHTLTYCDAVIGVNTSAMLEGAIVDKPSISILTEYYEKTQLGMGHFHHLLHGGFLEIARGFEEAVDIVADVIRGQDRKASQRRQFVHDFIRPHGLDRSPAWVMANLIESAGVSG